MTVVLAPVAGLAMKTTLGVSLSVFAPLSVSQAWPPGASNAWFRRKRLLYRSPAGQWEPAHATSNYATAIDRFNRVTFDAIETTVLRIEAQLQPLWSAGILEWQLEPPAAAPHARDQAFLDAPRQQNSSRAVNRYVDAHLDVARGGVSASVRPFTGGSKKESPCCRFFAG